MPRSAGEGAGWPGKTRIVRASFRFGAVFAATGAINTSDAREKTALAPIPENAKRAVARVIADAGVIQWLASIDAKGAQGARLHVGVTAQAVRDAFMAEGEDPARWALFCADPLGGEGAERLGVRMDQLLLLAICGALVRPLCVHLEQVGGPRCLLDGGVGRLGAH